MKPKLYCIGRLGRIRNGKLVIRCRVYVDFYVIVGSTMYKWVPQSGIENKNLVIKPRDLKGKALARWQMKQWRAPSKLKVKP